MKKISLLLALSLLLSTFTSMAIVHADGEYGTVTMIWNEEFNDSERTTWNEAHGFTFQAGRGFAITANSDGTATVTCTSGGYLYSRDYQGTYGAGVEAYVVEVKIDAVTDTGTNSDLLIGTEKEMYKQISGTGVYYTVVDRTGSGSVAYYDNAGVKTTETKTLNFGDKRLFHMYMSPRRTVTFDYIRVYTIDNDIEMTVDSKVSGGVVIETSAPIDASTATFTATGGGSTFNSTGVTYVDDKKYMVSFSGLDASTTYTLNKNSLTAIDGTTITTANSPTFTVADPNELYYNQYETVSAADYTTSQADHAFAASDGILNFTSTSTWKGFRLNFVPAVTEGKFVIEIRITGHEGSKKWQMGPGVDGTNEYNGSDLNSDGVYYAVIDKTNGTYKLYDSSFTLKNTQTISTSYSEISGWGFSSGAKALSIDYLAAYVAPNSFNFSILSSGLDYAVIKTTEPISEASTFSVEGYGGPFTATVAKENSGYNVYRLSFDELEYDDDYTIAADSLTGLNGAIVTDAEADFTTPEWVAPEYSDVVPFFIENANASNTYTKHYGSGTFSISRADGEVLMRETGGSKEVAVNTPITPGSSKFYVEYEQTEYALHKNFNVYPGGYSTSFPASDLRNKNGKFYGILDSTNGTYDIYYTDMSGTCTYVGQSTGSGAPSRLDINPGAAALARLKYIVAYDSQYLLTQLGTVNGNGITFKTTAPINTTSSTATFGSMSLILRPVSGEYLTYVAAFPETITAIVNTTADLTLDLDYLDGTGVPTVVYPDISLTGAAFANNKPIVTTVDEVDYIYGAVKFYNATNSAFTFYCIIAEYDTENERMLTNIKIQNCSVAANTVGQFVTSKRIEKVSGRQYKLFVWKDLDTLEILAK